MSFIFAAKRINLDAKTRSTTRWRNGGGITVGYMAWRVAEQGSTHIVGGSDPAATNLEIRVEAECASRTPRTDERESPNVEIRDMIRTWKRVCVAIY